MSNAIKLLTKAIEYDCNGRRMEALKLYQDGIASLLQELKDETDQEKRSHYQNKIQDYLKRAEILKEQIQKQATKGELVDKIFIMEGATDYDYDKIFRKYLDENVREICLEEPYIKEHYQMCNLIRFCELVVSSCRNLRYIKVTTTQDNRQNSEQSAGFKGITESLLGKRIKLEIDFNEHIHDRQIIFSNGYVIKIGRGLHYFKGNQGANRYSLGMYNYNFRECRQTNVDVFYCPENKK